MRRKTRVRFGKATTSKSSRALPSGLCFHRVGADQPLDEDFERERGRVRDSNTSLIERKGNGIGSFLPGRVRVSRHAAARPMKSNSDPSSSWPAASFCSRSIPSSPIRSATTGTPTASASNMAGAPNTTSPSIGASGVEMFGEIEDLANAGSFDDQNHSLGPTLFYNPGEDDDDEAAGMATMTTTRRSQVRPKWISP